MRRTTALTVSLLLLVAARAVAIPEGPPGATTGDDATSFHGLALSTDAQLFTGAATTSIPIDLPPGRREMKPNLALVYSSQTGNSSLGMGWELPLGRIERSTRLGVPSYGQTDTFVVILPDGAIELVALPDGSYAARIDESHVRVTVNTASNLWQLHDKSGRDYYFGTTAQSRVGPSPTNFSSTFAWHLTQIRDPNGNTIDITYSTHADAQGPTGQAYPVRIDYGGNGSQPHTVRVDFFWFQRDQDRLGRTLERHVSYAVGFRVLYDQILGEIYVTYTGLDSTYQGQLIRRYSLDWQASVTSGAPLLREVQLYGTGQTLLTNEDGTPASTKFEYNETAALLFPSVALSTDLYVNSFRNSGNDPDSDNCTTRDFLDLNGDGRPDLVRTGNWADTAAGRHWEVQFNRGPSAVPMFDSQPTSWPAELRCIEKREVSPDAAVYSTSWATFDMDGDGRPDLVDARRALEEQRWKVYRNLGNGFSPTVTYWALPNCASNEGGVCVDQIRVGNQTVTDNFVFQDTLDLNGDGRPDRIVTLSYFVQDGTWLVYWNNGLTDLGGGAFAGSFSEPTRIPAPHRYIRNGGPDTADRTIKSDLFDLNGDGLPDKVVARTSSNWDVWYGHGPQGFEPQAVQWVRPVSGREFLREWDNQRGIYLYDILDVNADGLPDFVDAGGWDANSNPFWRVAVNRGQGFAPAVNWPARTWLRKKHPNATLNDALQVDTFDIDGNGYPDSIRLPGDSGTTAQIWLGHEFPARSDSLQRISNNPGQYTNIAYVVAKPLDVLPTDPVDGALNAGAGYHLPFPTWVVSEIRQEDIAGPADVVTNYRFSGGYFDGMRREFLGFRLAVATDSYGASRMTQFHQTDALRGKPAAEFVTARDPLSASPGYLSQTLSLWAVNTLGSRQVLRLYDQQRFDYSSAADAPWNHSAARLATTVFTHDACGNITREQVFEGGTQLRSDTSAAFAGLNGGCNSYGVCVGICDRASSMSVAGGVTKTLAYDTRGNLTQTVLVGSGNPTTTMTYDAYGNVATVTEPEGATLQFLYAAAEGDRIQPYRTYRDGPGLTRQRHDFHYDPRFGKVTRERGVNLEAPETEYDAFGRVTKIAKDGQTLTTPTRTFTYFLGQRPRVEIRTREPNHWTGYRTETVCSDALGRPLQRQVERLVNGYTQTVVLGAVQRSFGGRVGAEYAPYTIQGLWTQCVGLPAAHPASRPSYDEFGRVLSRTLPDGVVLQSSYRTAWVNRTCDGNHGANPSAGSCTEEEVDALGHLRFRRTFMGSSTIAYATEQYTYNVAGQLTSVQQGTSPPTSITYDALGRRATVNDPDSGLWRFAYDRNGNVVYRDDPVTGRHVELAYDPFNRLLRRSVRASDTQGQGTATVLAEYTYDTAIRGLGRLGRVVDASGETRIQLYHLATGQPELVDKTITFGGVTKTFTTRNTFDEVGRVIGTNVPTPSGEETIEVRYTAGGQPDRLSTPDATYVDDILYNDLGAPTYISYGHHGYEYLTYGGPAERYRLRRLQTYLGATYPGTRARLIDYTYDANDNVTVMQDGQNQPISVTQEATYDALGRLTQSKQGSYIGTYTYDALGNFLSKGGKTYSYAQSPHRPTQVGPDAITYDANGNMTGLPGARTLTFDAEGRLTQVRRNGTLVATYLYDYAGARVAAQTPEGTTYFFPGFDVRGDTVLRHLRLGDRMIASSPVSGGNLLTASAAQTRGAVALARALVTGSTVVFLGIAIMLPGRRRGTVVAVVTFFVAAQLPLPSAAHAQCRQNPPPPGTIFYHVDHLGTPQLISDGDTYGAAEYFLTRAYGESGGTFDPHGIPVSESRADFRFTGHRAEDVTGLVYMGARYYDPALGLFVSQDPANQFFSPYSYGGGNPLNGRDPNGAGFWLIAAAIAFALGVIGSGVQAAINGGSPRDVIRAMGNGLTTGLITGAAAGLVGGAVSALGTSAYVSYQAALVGLGVYGAVQGFRSGNYALASAGIVSAAIGIAGVAGTLQPAGSGIQSAADASSLSDASNDVRGSYMLDEVVVEAPAIDAGLEEPWASPIDFIGLLGWGVIGTTRLAARGAAVAARRGVTVLGHYPGYIEYAESIGARYFKTIPSEIVERMGPAGLRAANTRFLDRLIARGDVAELSTPATQAIPNSTFAWELEYLASRGGYRLTADAMRMLPPGL